MKQIILFITLFVLAKVNAQITNTTNTAGLLYSEPEKVSEGYLLFAPLGSQHAYLINNCGLVVNQWTFDRTTIYSGCYLLEDGSILKLTSPQAYDFYNLESCVAHRSWDNELIWEYCITGETGYFHSDMHILPNGNVLVLMLEYFTVEEAILNGVNPASINNNYDLESVVELKPIGKDSAEIVWQWRMKDHLIQAYDASKDNYGIVAEHPRKYDANLFEISTHFNSIDYNENLDQIVVSSWHDSEIYIIDHSTTVEEAAGSTGGKYGHGGDFLFRWGNPANYGILKDQRLLGQHNPRWIPDNYDQFGGMMSIFNNRYEELLGNGSYNSAVVIIDPDPDGDGIYEMESGKFLPESYAYVLPNKGTVRGPMNSELMAGAVVQPNGNIVTCEAVQGRFTEFDRNGEVVWMYQSPVDSLTKQDSRFNVSVYKVEKYTADYPGLIGRDLCGTTIIENENLLSEECVEFWKPNIAFLQTINGTKVDFTLASKNPCNITWNFGDGTTSTEDNPSHTFEMPGSFEVCVNGSNCYGTDSYCKTIEIALSDISQFTQQGQLLITNLVEHHLFFTKKTIEKAIIYNEAGVKIMLKEKAPSSISVKHLPTGIYFLLIKENDKPKFNIQRFVKL